MPNGESSQIPQMLQQTNKKKLVLKLDIIPDTQLQSAGIPSEIC